MQEVNDIIFLFFDFFFLEGNGEYFYIDSPQAIKKVVNIVSQSFSNIIGTKTFMQLFLVPGVEIKKIYGIYKEDDKTNNVFPINDLRNNDSINIWFEFGYLLLSSICTSGLCKTHFRFTMVSIWNCLIFRKQKKSKSHLRKDHRFQEYGHYQFVSFWIYWWWHFISVWYRNQYFYFLLFGSRF